MSGFEKAHADTLKTCGAEIQGDGYSLDTSSKFASAKKAIEGKS